MLHGDISNQVGTTVGFRCENLLVKYREETIWDKFCNLVVGKERRAYIDEDVRDTMEFLYRNTECSVDIIINEDNYTGALKELIDDLPFNRVAFCSKPSQINARLRTGDLSFYVDNDVNQLSLVSSPYALTYTDFKKDYSRRIGRRAVSKAVR